MKVRDLIKRIEAEGWRQHSVKGMKYLVIYEKTGTGFSAYVPDLPGCITTGRTIEETQSLIQEAIEFHIEGLREDGLPIPEPTTAASYVEARALPAA